MSTGNTAVYESLKKTLPKLIEQANYSELYGIDFSSNAEWTTAHEKVLHKFLVANKYELEPSKTQLLNTLKWRKEFKPLEAKDEVHSDDLQKLGIITKSPSGKIITWNLYGAIKNRQEVFGKLDAFLRWRVGLMERGISLLDLSSDEFGTMDQVHDYMDVSFLRMDRETKAASSKTIKLFQDYYPEFLSAKYFVNVPFLMTWVFTFAKAFMSKETADKMHVIGNGKDLRYDLGDWIPKAYGGRAESFASIAAEASSGDKPAASAEVVNNATTAAVAATEAPLNA
ncbi:Phosphatidylinositol transfer protein SFH5 [Wickerhamiella sorbophila]|uniref:Phosphatidylinositol transfer protein SFH5 n=1 Tax=Wickerhamiella sorbophila TaxID=45607 RepID=A0A2T0FN74_9ASCO|nr:Phosphatidylinositol transfer protein SFH5 [Wickerhamiella sorbophila]PRT56434.1 Phosphatidylinositol transfer protein SFH5 [Wickerhamiella sorbophila]